MSTVLSKMARLLSVCLFFVLFQVVYLAPADEDKPDFDCPNENEYYEKCEVSVCVQSCKHLGMLIPCASVIVGCHHPKCLCKRNYLRNEEGVCVPTKECKEYKSAFESP